MHRGAILVLVLLLIALCVYARRGAVGEHQTFGDEPTRLSTADAIASLKMDPIPRRPERCYVVCE